MQQKKIEISAETVAESLRLARATQVAGQSKEQTQLIAQGIQKGIAEYKRAQKTKQRAADRAVRAAPRPHESYPGSIRPAARLPIHGERTNDDMDGRSDHGRIRHPSPETLSPAR